MPRNRCRRLPVWAIFLALTLLAGCTSLVQSLPPVDVYAIDPGWSQGAPALTEKKGSAVIRLAPVRATAAFTTTDILYTDARHRQHSYAYSRWRETPVRSMQSVLEVALGKSGHFRAVLPPTSVSGADLLLESSLLEFEHLLAEDGSSSGVVRMRFHLVDDRSKMVVASKELVSRMEVSTLDARGAAAAINQAALRLGGDLVAWLQVVAK